MKSLILAAVFACAAPAFAQNETQPSDPTMPAEQGVMPGNAQPSDPSVMPSDPGANAIMQPETTPATQPMDQNAATPPATSQAPEPAAPKDYPTCTRKLKDNCRNPDGK